MTARAFYQIKAERQSCSVPHLERQIHTHLFADNTWRETFKVIDKLPYSFSYKFEDASGRQSELQVLDWEAGALYWNCLKSVNGDEPKALAKVRQKYFHEFLKKDLHFFLGTTQQFRREIGSAKLKNQPGGGIPPEGWV